MLTNHHMLGDARVIIRPTYTAGHDMRDLDKNGSVIPDAHTVIPHSDPEDDFQSLLEFEDPSARQSRQVSAPAAELPSFMLGSLIKSPLFLLQRG